MNSMITMKRIFAGSILLLLAGASRAEDVIRIKGSDTIGGRAMPEIAETYRKLPRSGGIKFEIAALGSSTAFVGLFDGSADIGESSRPINEKEQATAKELGMRLQELVIGYDGVAVIVHPSNPVKDLTILQLSKLFSGGVRRWKELGGPDTPIRLIGRPSYSGTHAFFKEKAVRRGNAKGPEEFAAQIEVMEDNSEIVGAVSSDPNAVSYVGIGWLSASVRAVPIRSKPGDAAVPPTLESVRVGKYPLYRSLLMYVPPRPSAATADFLKFVLSSEGGAAMARSGFIPPDAGAPIPSFLASAPSLPVRSAVASAPPASLDRQPALQAQRAPMTQPQAPVEPAPAPKQETRAIVRVGFPFGAAALNSAAKKTIDTMAATLATGTSAVSITGHADSKGPVDVNRRVALARAHAVANRLLHDGVSAQRLRVDSAGADAPVASNNLDAGRAENRRVDIELIPQ